MSADPVNLATGHKILKICESKKRVNVGICTGYFAGVLNGVQATAHILKVDPVFCKPNNVITGQLKKTIIKHLRDNPTLLHRHSSFLIIQAVRIAYPCKKIKRMNYEIF